MLKKSDLIYLTIVFFLMRHFKLFNKINTFKKKKDISYSVGIKFIALLIITYVFKTVVIYLLKKLNLIKFLPDILKNDIIEGHAPGCVVVYGEPGEPLDTWQVATINETENVNLNHCYFNVETNSWDRNPNNVTTTDTTNCMCQSGTHRHQENDPLGPGTAERPIIDIGLSQPTVTTPSEDPGTGTPSVPETVTPSVPEPSVEPFIVMARNQDVQGEYPDSGINCAETCQNFGLTCTDNNYDFGDYLVANNQPRDLSPESNEYVNLIKQFIRGLDSEYRTRPDIELALNVPNSEWISPPNQEPSSEAPNFALIRDTASAPYIYYTSRQDPITGLRIYQVYYDMGSTQQPNSNCERESNGAYIAPRSWLGQNDTMHPLCSCHNPDGEPPEQIIEPMCHTPTDINISELNIQEPIENDLSMNNFDVTLQCADGYVGSPTASPCSGGGGDYTITSDCVEDPNIIEPMWVMDTSSDLGQAYLNGENRESPGQGPPTRSCNEVCSDQGLTCNTEDWPLMTQDLMSDILVDNGYEACALFVDHDNPDETFNPPSIAFYYNRMICQGTTQTPGNNQRYRDGGNTCSGGPCNNYEGFCEADSSTPSSQGRWSGNLRICSCV